MISRFKEDRVEGGETIHWYWVVSPGLGAASTWVSDVRSVIGRVIVHPITLHSPRPRGDMDPHGQCEFIECPCWCWIGSSLDPSLDLLGQAWAEGDESAVWSWLEGGLSTLAPGGGFDLG